jgi:hypothetical protein
MTELQDIIGQIPMGQIAGLLGTDEPTARAAVEAAVPTLLAGMQTMRRPRTVLRHSSRPWASTRMD